MSEVAPCTRGRQQDSARSVAVRVIRIRQTSDTGDRFGPRNLTSEIHQHGAQVVAVAQQARGALAPGEQERQRRLVGFLTVATRTGEDQVVAPIVCGLAAARGHVVEGDRARVDAALAVRADGTVAIEQPLARLCVRGPAGGE